MDVQDTISQARDAITVKRVFTEPYEKNGVTVIPAARISGAAGGGSGEGPEGTGAGSGSGFGVNARPVGAYVIRGEKVRWMPAVDVARVLALAAIGLLIARSILKLLVRREEVRAARMAPIE